MVSKETGTLSLRVPVWVRVTMECFGAEGGGGGSGGTVTIEVGEMVGVGELLFRASKDGVLDVGEERLSVELGDRVDCVIIE